MLFRSFFLSFVVTNFNKSLVLLSSVFKTIIKFLFTIFLFLFWLLLFGFLIVFVLLHTYHKIIHKGIFREL